MLILITGPSSSGKTEISNELVKSFQYKEIISYTTRAMRPGEKQDVDYHFITNERFQNMIANNYFLEYEEYSQGRLYGTTYKDINDAAKSDNIYVAVVTPGGLRKIKEFLPQNEIYAIFIEASLGRRVQRYVERCGVDKFNFDDMNEINARVNRDFGMFLNIEKEVDFVIANNSNSKDSLYYLSQRIVEKADKFFMKDRYYECLDL